MKTSRVEQATQSANTQQNNNKTGVNVLKLIPSVGLLLATTVFIFFEYIVFTKFGKV